ncbi:hypothetical protein ACHAWF_013222 [Thalassiosira exigua]
MSFESNHGKLLHKRNASCIETTLDGPSLPSTPQRQRSLQSTGSFNLHSQDTSIRSPPATGSVISHPRHRHRRRSTTILIYIITLLSLLVWISFLFTIAPTNLDSNTSTTHSIRNMNVTNDRIESGASFGELAASSFEPILTGALSALGMLHPASSDAVKVISVADESQRLEEDYEFIFYSLLGINMLAMIPSWCEGLTSTGQTHSQVNQQTDHLMNDGKQASIHSRLLKTYLPAYLLATCADWLQGPYKYALYSSYGYTQRDIAHLFVAGYGSGMVLGSIVGGLADSYGRKRLCLCYCLAYSFSVLMKHFKHFYLLLLGRVGGGIATSLLFSVFESWLIGAHGEWGLGKRGGLNKEDEEKWLAKSLSVSMYGSSLVAIGSGVLANLVVENSGKMRPLNVTPQGESMIYVGGYIAAFDTCLVPLGLCAALIVALWEENYGEATTEPKYAALQSNGQGSGHRDVEISKRQHTAGYLKKHSSVLLEDQPLIEVPGGSVPNAEEDEIPLTVGTRANQPQEGIFSALSKGMRTVWNSPNILRCCIIGSIFEGAMYIFIFLWTPALTSLQDMIDYSHGRVSTVQDTEKDSHVDGELPFGWIFSSFMICCMLGTIVFSRLSNAGVPASKSLAGILGLASLSCLAMACPNSIVRTASTSSANTPQYIGMLVYEFCIGF